MHKTFQRKTKDLPQYVGRQTNGLKFRFNLELYHAISNSKEFKNEARNLQFLPLLKIIDLRMHYAIEGIAGSVLFGTNLKFLAYKGYRD